MVGIGALTQFRAPIRRASPLRLAKVLLNKIDGVREDEGKDKGQRPEQVGNARVVGHRKPHVLMWRQTAPVCSIFITRVFTLWVTPATTHRRRNTSPKVIRTVPQRRKATV